MPNRQDSKIRFIFSALIGALILFNAGANGWAAGEKAPQTKAEPLPPGKKQKNPKIVEEKRATPPKENSSQWTSPWPEEDRGLRGM